MWYTRHTTTMTMYPAGQKATAMPMEGLLTHPEAKIRSSRRSTPGQERSLTIIQDILTCNPNRAALCHQEPSPALNRNRSSFSSTPGGAHLLAKRRMGHQQVRSAGHRMGMGPVSSRVEGNPPGRMQMQAGTFQPWVMLVQGKRRLMQTLPVHHMGRRSLGGHTEIGGKPKGRDQPRPAGQVLTWQVLGMQQLMQEMPVHQWGLLRPGGGQEMDEQAQDQDQDQPLQVVQLQMGQVPVVPQMQVGQLRKPMAQLKVALHRLLMGRQGFQQKTTSLAARLPGSRVSQGISSSSSSRTGIINSSIDQGLCSNSRVCTPARPPSLSTLQAQLHRILRCGCCLATRPGADLCGWSLASN